MSSAHKQKHSKNLNHRPYLKLQRFYYMLSKKKKTNIQFTPSWNTIIHIHKSNLLPRKAKNKVSSSLQLSFFVSLFLYHTNWIICWTIHPIKKKIVWISFNFSFKFLWCLSWVLDLWNECLSVLTTLLPCRFTNIYNKHTYQKQTNKNIISKNFWIE